MKIYGNLDLMQNILQGAVIEHATSYPTNAKLGQLFYDETNKKLACYDGSQWGAVSPGLPEVTEDATKYFDGIVSGVFKQKAFIEAPMTGLTVGTILDASKDLGQNLKLLDDAATEAKSFTMKKEATAESGYLATYQLYHTVAGTQTAVGDKINIPLDYLVKSAEVKTCSTKDQPVSGLNPGDKYIDFTVNVQSGTGTESHMYIAVKDMVTAYSAGDGIDISSSNEISINISEVDGVKQGLAISTEGKLYVNCGSNSTKINDSGAIEVKVEANKGLTTGSNGLTTVLGNGMDVDANGLKVKAKADAGIVVDADGVSAKAADGIQIDSNGIGLKLKASEASGLSVDSNGLTLAAASATQNGYLAKEDYAKWSKMLLTVSKTTDANGKITFSATDVPGFNVTGITGTFMIDSDIAMPGSIAIASGTATITFTGAASKAVACSVVLDLTAAS